MYLNYEILLNGYQTIYLGESIPITSLTDLKNSFEKITFLSYLTVEPNQEEVNNFVQEFQTTILDNTKHELLLLGRMTEFIEQNNKFENINIFNSIEELTASL